MTAIIVFLMSAGATEDPKTGPWPGPFIVVLNRSPFPIKQYVVRCFARSGLYFPDEETVHYEEFGGWAGAYRRSLNVFWRRAIGIPLDRAADPLLGWRVPQIDN